MPLQIGQRLGSYEITSLLGKGGMGEVYLARDARLDRSVAIKTLPEQFESDAERLARFEREAKILASLNHPNIGAIYGIEKHDGQHILVLELVDGQTLADLVARGPMPVNESLRLAVQIAGALQAAHEKGVIHRDLKPANIKITRDGTVKVLDFGLAKAGDVESSDGDGLSNSPTLKTMASTPGMILGTAAYMSPEQAKGRPVDRRTDIFAFGCVLYEMLTGKRAFEGEDVSDTLAAVLRAEPDWSALPQDVPPGLRTLIQRCLAKDRANRIAEISFARLLLSEPDFVGNAGAPAIASRAAQRRLFLRTALWIGAVVLLSAAAGGALVWALKRSTGSAQVMRFSIALPVGQTFSSGRNSNIAISPDGTEIVYSANFRLYRRAVSDFEAKPIAGTESKEPITNPAFSPDGRSIAFYSTEDSAIKRIAVDGGTPFTITRSGATKINWTTEGILFAVQNSALRISPEGGTPEKLASFGDAENVSGFQMLPGGNVLFTLTSVSQTRRGGDPFDFDRSATSKVVVQSLTTGDRKTLVDGSDGRYLASGHLIYLRGGTLFAVPFDAKQLNLSGSAVPVLVGVERLIGSGGSAHLSVSNTGTLIYVPGSATGSVRALMATDRNGSTPLPVPPAPYLHPRVSRDGKHVAVGIEDEQDAYVSIYDLPAAGALRRLTLAGEGHNRFPVWSGDGQFMAFQSDREGDPSIFMRRADGSSPAVRLTKAESGVSHVPESWSPDGQTLLFSSNKDRTFALWSLSVENKTVAPFGNVQSTDPIGATFSPNGRWVAYASSDARGQIRTPNKGVYVQPFPPTGARYQMPKESQDYAPVWSLTSAELFYIPTASRFSVVAIQTQPGFRFGKATTLPTPPTRDRVTSNIRDYDVMPDGRFISTVPAADETVSPATGPPQIRVVLSWFEELKQRVPVH
jgi:eukaryotic-like serine/threonine-protein kinase